MSPGPQQDSSPAPNILSPQAGLGPPPSKPLTKKRPHRRSPQACDECRLRKRACDAVEPCRPCQRAGLSTYHMLHLHVVLALTGIQSALINSGAQYLLLPLESGISKII